MYDDTKTCACFGHSDFPEGFNTEELKARVKKAMYNAVKDGFRTFLFGGLSDFDDLCYNAISEIKAEKTRTGIKRIFIFPLEAQLRKHPWWFRHFNGENEYEYLDCLSLDYTGWYRSLYFRNCSMIDLSELVLFWVEERKDSGAYKAYKYAVKKKKPLINFK